VAVYINFKAREYKGDPLFMTAGFLAKGRMLLLRSNRYKRFPAKLFTLRIDWPGRRLIGRADAHGKPARSNIIILQ